MNDIYPLTVIGDRYNGVYSSGKFTAWNQFYYRIPEEVDGSDPECMIFWREFKQGEPIGFLERPMCVGFGNTPTEAIKDLQEKLTQFNSK